MYIMNDNKEVLAQKIISFYFPSERAIQVTLPPACLYIRGIDENYRRGGIHIKTYLPFLL